MVDLIVLAIIKYLPCHDEYLKTFCDDNVLKNHKILCIKDLELFSTLYITKNDKKGNCYTCHYMYVHVCACLHYLCYSQSLLVPTTHCVVLRFNASVGTTHVKQPMAGYQEHTTGSKMEILVSNHPTTSSTITTLLNVCVVAHLAWWAQLVVEHWLEAVVWV